MFRELIIDLLERLFYAKCTECGEVDVTASLPEVREWGGGYV